MQEEVFHEVADEFITFANQLSEDWAVPMLSAAFMYAAARYNAFHASEKAYTVDGQQQAIQFLCEQFRKMLEENLSEMAQAR